MLITVKAKEPKRYADGTEFYPYTVYLRVAENHPLSQKVEGYDGFWCMSETCDPAVKPREATKAKVEVMGRRPLMDPLKDDNGNIIPWTDDDGNEYENPMVDIIRLTDIGGVTAESKVALAALAKLQ